MADLDDFGVRYVNLDELTTIGGESEVDLSNVNSSVFGTSSNSTRDNQISEPQIIQRRGNGGSAGSDSGIASNEPVQAAQKLETIEQIIDKIGFGRFQIKLILLVGFALTADSMEMLTLSVLAPALRCEWALTPFDESMITVVVFIGMLLGSAAWGKFCDRYGRKRCLIMFAALTGYFGLLCAFSPRFVWVLVLRGLVGFAIGGAPQTVTLLTEFLPSLYRAKCLIGMQVFWAFGVFFETALALVVMPTLGWRYLLAFSTMPLFFFCILCAWLPESPRYLVVSGQLDSVKHILEKVSRNNYPHLAKSRDQARAQGATTSSSSMRERNMNANRGAGAAMTSDASTTSNEPAAALPNSFDLFDIDVSQLRIPTRADRGQVVQLFSKTYSRITLTLWPMWFSSAFSYYGIVLLTTVLLNGGSQSDLACRANCRPMTTADYVDLILTSIAEFVSLLGVFFIDSLGRRRSMAVQYGGFAVFTLLLVTIPGVGGGVPLPPVPSRWQTALLFLSRTFISSAYNTIYVYTPEVYPTSVRAIGLGACSSMARVGAILTPLVAQMLVSVSPITTICLYTVAGIFATIASIVLPVETLGRRTHDTVADAEAEADRSSSAIANTSAPTSSATTADC